MKRMKTEQKRRLAAIVAIVLIAAMVLSAALPIFFSTANAAQSNADYTIEAEIGFGGYAKINSNVPVNITVTNNTGKAFKGSIAVLVTCESGSYAVGPATRDYNRFSREAEIAAGGSKTVSFTVPVRYIQRTVKIQLLKGKNTLAEESVPFNVCSDEEYWVGVLSRSSDSLGYLKPSYYTDMSGRITDLGSTLSLSSASGAVDTSSIDVYVINDYDLAALGDLQLQEIMDNVSRGAVMLIGGGSPIGSLDRLRLDTLTETEIPYYDNDGNGYGSYISDIYTGYSLGGGRIINTSVNFGTENAGSNTEADGLITSAYHSAYIRKSFSDNSIESSLPGYTNRLPNFTDNTIQIIFALIYIYILFVPLLYFRLKKKDKREAAVKIIPAAALGVSVLIYLVSFNTVYKKPIASIVSYVDLRNMQDNKAMSTTCMNVLTQNKGDINIDLPGGAEIKEVSDESYSYGYYDTDQSGDDRININAEIISSDDGTEIELKDRTRWESSYITLADSYELKGDMECSAEINSSTGNLVGEIKNNTGEDFEEFIVAAVTDEGICKLKMYGKVVDGESVNISSLFNVGTDKPQDLYTLFNDSIYYDRTRTEEDYKVEQRVDIAEGVLGEYESYNYGSNGVSMGASRVKLEVIGFTEEYVYGGDTRVNNKKVTGSGMAVFGNEFNVDMSEYLEQNYINQGFSKNTAIGFDNCEISGNGELYIYDINEDVELTFDNSNYQEFSIFWDTDADISIYNIYIYNNYYDEWIMFSNGQRYSGIDAYTNDDGYIRLRAVGFTEEYVPLPIITYYD